MRPLFSRTAFKTAGGLLFLLANVCWAQSADELVEKGKVFERKFQTNDALPLYLAAEKLEPNNSHILVRIARQYRYVLSGESSKQDKLRLGHIALDYSVRAAAAGARDAEAQLAPAITLGKMLPYLPTKQQVAHSPRSKESVDKALALDPRNDTAWHVLGRWHRVLADVSLVKRYLAEMIYGSLTQGSNDEGEHALPDELQI